MEPVIRLQKVTKRFGANTALDGVSLEVPPAVVFALLGENGAGKTTAIRILLGLIEATSGRGWKFAGPTLKSRLGFVNSLSATLSAPQVFVPGGARIRSATSR